LCLPLTGLSQSAGAEAGPPFPRAELFRCRPLSRRAAVPAR